MSTTCNIRSDLSLMAALIPEKASVLDIGCGDGSLLAHLRDSNGVRGFGLEIDSDAVTQAVAQGLSVVQGDADSDLAQYPDKAFDVVILSNSLQALRQPDLAIKEALRIGKRAIISFPNFGHWRVRTHLLLQGTMPVSKALPASWYETSNIHLCTILDFIKLARQETFALESAYALYSGHEPRKFNPAASLLPNLMAEAALFVLSGS